MIIPCSSHSPDPFPPAAPMEELMRYMCGALLRLGAFSFHAPLEALRGLVKSEDQRKKRTEGWYMRYVTYAILII